jgi:hypothetical protein
MVRPPWLGRGHRSRRRRACFPSGRREGYARDDAVEEDGKDVHPVRDNDGDNARQEAERLENVHLARQWAVPEHHNLSTAHHYMSARGTAWAIPAWPMQGSEEK